VRRVVLVGGLVAVTAGLGALSSCPTLLGAETRRHDAKLRRWLRAGEACLAGRRRAGLGPYNLVFDHLVALEDRDFWTRWTSASAKGLVRASIRNLRSGRVCEGGSGLPQQLATAAIEATDREAGALGPRPHDLRFKLHQFSAAARVFGEIPRGAFEVTYLDRLPCGPVVGVRPCAVHLFGRELSVDDPWVEAKAALLAAQVRAPTRLHADTDALVLRARYSMGLLDRADEQALAAAAAALRGNRGRRALARHYEGRSVCERRSSDGIDGVLAALDAGAAHAREGLAGHGVTVFGAALLGDRYASVGGDWEESRFPAGSWAKLWTIKAIASLGPEPRRFLTEVRLPPTLPVWDFRLRRWSPGSLGRLDGPIDLVEAVARSHNQACLSYLYFPYWLDPPRLESLLRSHLSRRERRRYGTRADRRLALRALSAVSEFPYLELPEAADPAFRNRALLLLALRLYARSVEADLPGAHVPEVPAVLLGAGLAATPERWVRALAGVWFAPGPGCRPTRTGELLAAAMARRGTLTAVVRRLGVAAPAKTGTTPRSAQAALGLCAGTADGPRPLVLAFWAFRPDWGPVGRVQGAHLGVALREAARALAASGTSLQGPLRQRGREDAPLGAGQTARVEGTP